MNIKEQDLSKFAKKAEEIIDALPPKAKTVVVVLGAGTIFCYSVSEVCKNATTFAKEGLPPMVENIIRLKQGASGMIIDEFCETQIVDDSSAA